MADTKFKNILHVFQVRIDHSVKKYCLFSFFDEIEPHKNLIKITTIREAMKNSSNHPLYLSVANKNDREISNKIV